MTTPERDYRFPPEPFRADWNREIADQIFGSIGSRLRALEAKRSELQALIDDLSFNGQARIDEAITPLIATQRAVLTTLAADIDREIQRINTLFREFDERTQAALVSLDTEIAAALVDANRSISTAIAQINAEVTAVRERVDAILAGGLPAADVNEDATRVFVTPEQRTQIGDTVDRVGLLERVPTKAEAVSGIDDELRMTPRATADAIRASEASTRMTPERLFQLCW